MIVASQAGGASRMRRRHCLLQWPIRLIAFFGVLVGVAAELRAGLLGGDGDPFVCAEIVVAIDGSESTREAGFNRQTRALAAAFRHRYVHAALRDCLPGSTALAMFTWSGALQQEPCLSWRVIRNGRECVLSAFALQRCHFGGTTDIGATIEHAVRMIETSPYRSFYQIILLLTNGRTDRGSEPRVERARRAAAELGITVVGHALVPKLSGWTSGARSGGPDPFQSYTRRHVSVGPRSFSSSSDTTSDMPAVIDTMIRMLRQELH